jgi:DNA-binding PadR family transcriptional regulator
VPERDLSLGEWAVLALLDEHPAHGWSLAATLGRGGDVGVAWTLSRPLVYRSLEILERRGLVEPVGVEQGARGPTRTILRPTRRGREAVRRWLGQPVGHVRDMRSAFLLKLILTERAGRDAAPLLQAQRAAIEPFVVQLAETAEATSAAASLLARFRLETAQAALHFIDDRLAATAPALAATKAD